MELTHDALIALLIKDNLGDEVDEIFDICAQGFDVQVTCPEKHVFRLACEEILKKLENFGREIEFVTENSFICLKKEHQIKNMVIIPILFLNSGEKPVEGAGFVNYNTLHTLQLLPSVGECIKTILQFYNLSIFNAIFDKTRIQPMRRYLLEQGISKFIDAVIEITYKEGFLEKKDYLEEYVSGILQAKKPVEGAVCSQKAISQTLNWILEATPDPIIFNKALLSFYCVHILRMNISQATFALKVTRSTLNSHLAMARSLNLQKFFSTAVADFQSSK